jgi:hypothetical protein
MNPKLVTFWRPSYQKLRLSSSDFAIGDTVAPLSEIVSIVPVKRGIVLKTGSEEYFFSTREKDSDGLLCNAVEHLRFGRRQATRRVLVKMEIGRYFSGIICVVILVLSWHTANWDGQMPSFWKLWDFGRLWVAGGAAVYGTLYGWLKWRFTFAPKN